MTCVTLVNVIHKTGYCTPVSSFLIKTFIIFTYSRVRVIENKTDENKTKRILMFISTKTFVPVIDELDKNRKRVQYQTRKQARTIILYFSFTLFAFSYLKLVKFSDLSCFVTFLVVWQGEETIGNRHVGTTVLSAMEQLPKQYDICLSSAAGNGVFRGRHIGVQWPLTQGS